LIPLVYAEIIEVLSESVGDFRRAIMLAESYRTLFFFSEGRLPTTYAGFLANIFFLLVASVWEGELGMDE
jgi:hypothetical protein